MDPSGILMALGASQRRLRVEALTMASVGALNILLFTFGGDALFVAAAFVSTWCISRIEAQHTAGVALIANLLRPGAAIQHRGHIVDLSFTLALNADPYGLSGKRVAP